MKELWLHNNNIKNIRGIGRLSKLNHLDVSFNPLKYGVEEIEKLRSLKRLEVREVPKEIVDYIYENYNKFTILDKIFIENRMAENSKKRENETVSNYHQLKLDATDGGMRLTDKAKDYLKIEESTN